MIRSNALGTMPSYPAIAEWAVGVLELATAPPLAVRWRIWSLAIAPQIESIPVRMPDGFKCSSNIRASPNRRDHSAQA